MVKTAFSKGVKKELSLSLFQTVIMLLFNAADTVSLKEILEKTKLDDKECRRTLQVCTTVCPQMFALKCLPSNVCPQTNS